MGLLYSMANNLIKLSVLHFYQAVFPNQKFGYTVYLVTALTLAYWFGHIMTTFLLRQPFEYNRNKITISAHCGDRMAGYLFTGIANILVHVIVVALPLPLL